jgi:uncharacterized membrane protein YcaP (DUF421 family)
MAELWNAVEGLLGIGQDSMDLSIPNMALRAVVVYVAALAMVRIGEKRFFGKNTAFDLILGIIFGSIVSRAITGQSAFFPTLTAALMVILLHWFFAMVAFHVHPFALWIKGTSRVLVQEGEIQWDAMRKSHIGKHDLMTALRSEANIDTLDKVQEARLERSGDISVIKKGSEPKVLEISVADGVQTVRIQLG